MKRNRKFQVLIYKPVIFAFLFVLSFFFSFSKCEKSRSEIILLRLEGVIDPIAANYIVRGIESAERKNALCVILQLDTPGGLDRSMRIITQRLLNTYLPTVVYIAPPGARAASAGTFIAYCADIIAMAPGTNIGAAQPVDITGKKTSEKIINDAAAYLRSIAESKGRNIDFAEAFVRQGSSLTSEEAFKKNIIDILARDVSDLLRKLNGREIFIRSTGTKIKLDTEFSSLTEINMNFSERFLHAIVDPNIALLLLLIGVYGLIYELATPGFGFPGITGAICLLLSLVALGSLPLNLGGLFLILLAIGLFVAEALTPGIGVLMAGGIISLILGMLLIFSPFSGSQAPYISIRPALSVIIIITILTAGFFLFAFSKALQIRKKHPVSGTEGLIGAIGVVRVDLNPNGIVHVSGEDWSAISESGYIPKGQKVRVVKVEGLTIKVEPL